MGSLQNSQRIDCEGIDRIACKGSSDLTIWYNYWAKIANQDYDSTSIIANYCPTGYCCQDIDGCAHSPSYSYSNSMNNVNESQQHQFRVNGRNASSKLCGEYIDGYSVVLESSEC